jgi:hypothetical protein
MPDANDWAAAAAERLLTFLPLVPHSDFAESHWTGMLAAALRAAERRGREAEQARVQQLENALAGMLESYDLLIGSQSPFEAGSTAWGVIVGVFLDEPSRARSLLGCPAPAGEE